MKLTPAIELIHRNRLKSDIQQVPDTGAVFTKPTFFSSVQDFVDAVGKQVAAGDNLEVQFCQITFLKFEDSPNDPCPDDPLCWLHYRLHFFHQFEQQRANGTNSHDTFVAMLLNLRNKFLIEQDFDGGNTERKPLSPEQFIITDVESTYFKGAYGHYTNLISKIELS